ncbi:MAG: patatin-like phospholipase family protein [Woeseiaceae bacterium]|nr:patatin-like phospholipase family protein [Woeseiaceae bacterium]
MAQEADDSPTVSLVLGSGGARGHAHIGVIRAIEERGVRIRNIAGTSMGSVIGGMRAAGELDTYADWAFALSGKDVVRLLDFAFTWTSIFKGERIFGVLKELVGDRDIEDLDLGFTAVATAIDEQREVWLNRGSLFRAIRASTAVPGVFSPVEIGGRTLVDGGLINPIPIAPTLNDATDMTIAVNLNSLAESYSPPEGEAAEPLPDGASYAQKISRFIRELIADDDSESPAPDAADLLTRSIDVMQGAIARLKLAAYSPDKVIEIPRDACTFFEFHRAREMADLGYEKTMAALDDMEL